MRYKSVWDALKLTFDEHKIVSVVGAGGKTSLIMELCREAVESGKRVIITTTTHMAMDSALPFVEYESGIEEIREEIKLHLHNSSYVVVASMDHEKHKWSAVPADQRGLQALSELADILLIEADGARRLPVKAPGEREPQIYEKSAAVIGVIGLDGIAKPIKDISFRPEILSKMLGKSISEELTSENLCSIWENIGLLRKNVGEKPYRVFLNKAELLDEKLLSRMKKTADKSSEIVTIGSIHKRQYQRAGKRLQMVLMASGFSRRFGSNKLLHEIHGRPMYQIAADRMKAAAEEIEKKGDCWKSVEPVVITRYPEIENYCREMHIRCIRNDHAERGMSESMKLGLLSSPDAEAFLFMTADMPYLKIETLERLLRLFYRSEKGIGSLSLDNVPMNPCVFSEKYMQELLAIQGDRGGKSVVKAHLEDVLLVEAAKEELYDIDLPDIVK